MARLTACSLLCFGLLVPSALAQEASTLTGDAFNVDLVSGPVRGSGRIVGLGGAYSALAYGADGAAWSPAAYAVRTLWETEWFEWDLAFDYSPGTFSKTDYDNDGRPGFRYSDFVFLTFGGRFTFGAVGLGALFRTQDYRIDDDARLSLLIANYGSSYAFAGGQLIAGLSVRTASLTMADSGGSELVSYAGSGPEVGALFAPSRLPMRIGLTARLPVEAGKSDNARIAAGLELPRRLLLPAEAQLGVAYQLGSRPLNRRFVNPHDEALRLTRALWARRHQRQREQVARERAARRFAAADGALVAPTPQDESGVELMPSDPVWLAEELHLRAREDLELQGEIEEAELARAAEARALPREYVLLSAETVFMGTTEDAVGLESFLSQQRQDAGRHVSVGFRVGAEGEPVQRRWKLRLGSYLEPSRFSGGSYRVHGTIGSEVRLFAWDVFGLLDSFDVRIGASFDAAVRYSHLGFGIGFWN